MMYNSKPYAYLIFLRIGILTLCIMLPGFLTAQNIPTHNNLTPDAQLPESQEMVFDGQNLAVVWEDMRFGMPKLFFNKYKFTSSSATPVLNQDVCVTPESAGIAKPFIMFFENHYWIFYLGASGSSTQIFCRPLNANGEPVNDNPVQVTQSRDGVLDYHLVMGTQEIGIVYSRSSSTGELPDLYFCRWDYLTNNTTFEQRLTQSGINHISDPLVLYDGFDFSVFWVEQNIYQVKRIRYKQIYYSGLYDYPAHYITDPSVQCSNPRAIWNPEIEIFELLYQREKPNLPSQICLSRVTRTGAVSLDGHVLSDPDRPSKNPSITLCDSLYAMSWQSEHPRTHSVSLYVSLFQRNSVVDYIVPDKPFLERIFFITLDQFYRFDTQPVLSYFMNDNFSGSLFISWIKPVGYNQSVFSSRFLLN